MHTNTNNNNNSDHFVQISKHQQTNKHEQHKLSSAISHSHLNPITVFSKTNLEIYTQ